VDVRAANSGRTLRVEVDARLTCRLTVGAVLPSGTAVRSVRLDGRHVGYRRTDTARGAEVLVDAAAAGHHTLAVTVSPR
jgi:hypothetical protein